MAESTSADVPEETAAAVTERDTSMNIYQRLHGVMTDLRHLDKDKEATISSKRTGKTFSYGYISHDAVSGAVHPLLVKHGIQVVPSVETAVNNGNRCEMIVNVGFVNIDNPDDVSTVRVVGYGADNEDKGPGKAFSYAMKYAYLKVFCLNAGDDIEEQDVPHEPETVSPDRFADAVDREKEALRLVANNLKAAISGVTTVKELKALQRDHKDWLMAAPDVTREYFVNLIEARKEEVDNDD